MRTLLVFLILIFTIATRASEPLTAEIPSQTWPPVGPAAVPEGVTTHERLVNFGIVYAFDWAEYAVQQHQTILDNGSFHNWATNWYQPHFDNDTFQYNLFLHSMVGQGYYQWYRSRGYTVKEAFLWSFASSLAFEMFIETVTERPSFQDIYQTPVYGTIVGIGLEKLSQACHKTETALGHVCGYLLDPFTLIPKTPKVAVYPDFATGHYVANLKWEF